MGLINLGNVIGDLRIDSGNVILDVSGTNSLYIPYLVDIGRRYGHVVKGVIRNDEHIGLGDEVVLYTY